MITVIYCTRETKPEHKEHLIKTSGLHKNIEVIEIINNGESLTKAYNRGLKQAKNDIVVFCHDDLTIETNQWGKKLTKMFEKNPEFGIIGVAGSKNMPESGQWWANPKKMYGRVAHTHEGKTWLSAYSDDLGQTLEEVVVCDGVWFALDKTRIKKEFNENVEGFHFYDVTFAFENYLEGVKVGVTTAIRINHQSIGMTNESWENNRLQFIDNFKSNLPKNAPKTMRKGQKLKVLVGCLKLHNTSPEQTYILNLITSLVKNNCDVSVVSNINDKFSDKLKKLGVKIYQLNEPPNFKLGDGKWVLNGPNGQKVTSVENNLYKISNKDYDILYLSQTPIINHLLRLYPDTETICSVHSCESIDEPVINEQIVNYVAINETIKKELIEKYNINESKILDYNIDEHIDVNLKQIDTYVFVHDQSIIIDYEKNNKFSGLSNYKYVFLGSADTSLLKKYDNIIIARDLEYNLEDYPKFTAFSGWYALLKNNLLNKNNDIMLLEYDVHLIENFEKNVLSSFKERPKMIGFVPFEMTNYHFINNPNWVSTVSSAIKKTYNVDVLDKIKNYIDNSVKNKKNPKWMSTNNIMFEYETFIKYMKWFEPLIEDVKNDINCGHAQERCLTFYAMLNNVKFDFIEGVLKHEQLDSHKTQGHSVNFDEALKRLS
jgi:hypothetical protein